MKNAWGICDICGFRYKYTELKKNSYGLLVCPEDYEGGYDLMNHPQNKPAPHRTEIEIIRNPRPETEDFSGDGTTSISPAGWFTSA